jgi:hypothetical protein
MPRRWGDLADDPDTVIEHAKHELLPQPFHHADCWWQLSSTAGFAVGILKAHLFFWLSEPASNEHIKAVPAEHAPAIGRAPLNAAQPHYIAAPIIEGGYDPVPRRTGRRQGLEREVLLPLPTPHWRPSCAQSRLSPGPSTIGSSEQVTGATKL